MNNNQTLGTVSYEFTVENIASENGAAITPVWFGLHDGSFDTFEAGETASSGVMYLAEDGVTGLEPTIPGLVDTLIDLGLEVADLPATENTLAGIFAASEAGQNGGTQGLVSSVEQPLGVLPGESASTTFTIDPSNLENNRFINFGAMFFPSNDAFIANDTAIEIFDESGNFLGLDLILTGDNVYDAGTEVNDEDPASVPFDLAITGDGIDENGTVQLHEGFLPLGEGGVLDFAEGMFANADFNDQENGIGRISITPVITGTDSNDSLYGTGVRERIQGLAGNDYIHGGYGNDTLDGGAGNDQLWGGAGADQYVLRAGDGVDQIFDFQDNTDVFTFGDQLVYDDLTITQGSGVSIIEITNTGEELAYVHDVAATDLTAIDFI